MVGELSERLRLHLKLPIYRNGYALIASQGINAVCGVAYWILAARLYTSEHVGLQSALISTMMLLAGVSQLGYQHVLTRFAPVAGRSTARLIVVAYAVSIAVATPVALGFLGSVTSLAPAMSVLSTDWVLGPWFVLAVLAWCIFVLQDSALTGLGRATWVPIENGVFAVSKIVLLVVLAESFPAHGVFGSWTIAVVLASVPTNALIFGRFAPEHARRDPTRAVDVRPSSLLRYSLGNYVASLFWLASSSLLPVLVTRELGAAQNAYFYLPWQVALILASVASNVGISLTVEASKDRAPLELYTRKVLTMLALFVMPPVLIVVLGAPSILSIFGEAYASEGVTTLRLLTLGVLPFAVVSLFVSVARVQQRTRAVVAAIGSSSTLTVLLASVLLQPLGIAGVGLAWLIGQGSVAAVVFVVELWPMCLRSGERARTGEPASLTAEVNPV